MTFQRLIIVFVCMTKYDISEMGEHVQRGIEREDELNKELFINTKRRPRLAAVRAVEQIVK